MTPPVEESPSSVTIRAERELTGSMRVAFVHEVVVRIAADADIRVRRSRRSCAGTGSTSRPVPSPHHTEAVRIGADLRLRILFAAGVEEADTVR